MNWFDLAIVVVVAVSAISGFAKGFIRLGIGLAATILGFLLAAWFYRSAGDLLMGVVPSRLVANVVGFFLIFGLAGAIGGLLSLLAARAMKLIGLGFLDRIGGLAFGAVRGALIAAVVIMIMLAFPRKPPQMIVHSYFAPYLVGAAQTLSKLTPFELRDGFRQTYDELQRMWEDVLKKRPKKLQEDKASL